MDTYTKTALIVGGGALLLMVGVPLIVGSVVGGQGWGMMGPGMMWGVSWMWLTPVVVVVTLGAVVWAIVALAQRSGPSGGSTGAHDDRGSAMEILKRRYAQGDISKEEYEEKKRDLA